MQKEGKDSTRLTRREFMTLSGAGLTGMALAGIPEWGQGAEKKSKYGGKIRIGQRYGSTGLDAHKNQDHADYRNYCLMYNALTEQGPLPQVEVHPTLAKSWKSLRTAGNISSLCEKG